MEAYFAAKKRLFVAGGTGGSAPRVSIVNLDDAAGPALAEELRGSATEVVPYGWSSGDVHARDVELSATGSRFTICSPAGEVEIETSLAGRVNVWNILAAAAAAHARGISLQDIAAGVKALGSVPGRFQQVQCGQPFAVVVDYAHTDDALRNLTRMARELAGSRRVITLFGCGGDRDRSKRPLMARAAALSSDLVVLTSDNPRSEDPAAILRDAEAGFAGSSVAYRVIEDRAEAIAFAIAEANAGDIVLLAGKGHEKTQTTRDGVHPFDDVLVAHAALESLKLCN
jgi:UDP-N-acetylmuramoyl-L-alanyl-D-glutamate--2,6-diaminopimelate ligase